MKYQALSQHKGEKGYHNLTSLWVADNMLNISINFQEKLFFFFLVFVF